MIARATVATRRCCRGTVARALHETTSNGSGEAGTPARASAAHAALLRSLSAAFPASAPPPEDAAAWPETLVRRWFEDGGALRVAALDAEPPTAVTRALIDRVGGAFRKRDLAPIDIAGGLLGAARAGDGASLRAVAAALESDGFARATLGLGSEAAARAADEAHAAWPRMVAGEIADQTTGERVAGVSPSGAARGDRYVLSRRLPDARAIRRADDALGTVFDALAPLLEGGVGKRSDAFVARFPGDGLGYGSHLDGDDDSLYTMILYTSEGWTPAHGGALEVLDEARETWWTVPPMADAVALFRSDVLHRVAPCRAPRVALTTFLSARESEQAALFSALAFSV